MTNFSKIVRAAYREILEREPDPGGLAGWNTRMQNGLSEEELREAFIRSPEFAQRNPSPPPIPDPEPGPLVPLRIEGPRLIPSLRGATGCCAGPPPNRWGQGWPLVPPEQVDAYAAAHFNVTEVRTGPFVDDGWDLLRRRLRPSVQYANVKGLYVIVDLVDNWAFAHPGNQLYADTCAVTQGPPPDRYLRWVDEVVNATGDLHVLYNIGNEGFRCQPSAAWEDAIYGRAKAMLTARGFPDRPVGSTFRLNALAEQPQRHRYDVAYVHGWGVPEVSDVPTLLIESDNRHHSLQEYRELITEAEHRGTYVVAWRGQTDDPTWKAFLESYGGHEPTVVPGEPLAVIVSPEDVQPSFWLDTTDVRVTLAQTVTEAVDRVVARNPWLFRSDDGGRTWLLGYGASARFDEILRADFWSLTQHELQPRPSIVGDISPLGKQDEIHVFRDTGEKPPRGIVEGYHLIAFGQGEIRRNAIQAHKGNLLYSPV